MDFDVAYFVGRHALARRFAKVPLDFVSNFECIRVTSPKLEEIVEENYSIFPSDTLVTQLMLVLD
jgi:hypothetical protein